MERSGSQKALKVFGILYIIIGIIVIVVGILAMVTGIGVAALGSTGDIDETTVIAGSGVIVLSAILAIIGGIISLICGIFSNRAANDCQQWRGAWIIAIVSLIVNVISLISGIAGHQQSAGSAVVSVIWALLIFWLCNNVKIGAEWLILSSA